MRYIEEREAERLYDEMLDECNEEIVICGLKYSPSRVLSEVDPIAYRCGFTDWLAGEGLTTDKDEADEA